MSDLTAEDIKSRLRALVNDLARAEVALANARDAEVDARHTYEQARRNARLLPNPQRPVPDRRTVLADDVEAWIDEQVKDARRAYDIAVVKRESAETHLWTLKDQAQIVMSLNASERAAWQMAGAA